MKRHIVTIIILQLLSITALAYKAHEWGTFTSVVGSDGQTLHGMYHEDEELPDFVHGFGVTQNQPGPIFQPDECQSMKFCFTPNILSSNIITQKMETPVIYFYSDQAQRVTVDVDFPEGIITDTYPAPVASSPQFSDDMLFENGSAQFVVDILKPGINLNAIPPAVEDHNIYGHARKTSSNLIRTNSEVEKFIFYRGLGRFQPRINIRSKQGGLTIHSHRKNLPESAFLVYVNKHGRARVHPFIGSKASNSPDIEGDEYFYHFDDKTIETLKAPMSGIDPTFVGDDAKNLLVDALESSGLYRDEAESMINTWENGYLKVPGLRLLYIVPKNEVARSLPLRFSPAPQEVQRVFVARMEIMLESEETALVKRVIREQHLLDVPSLGRFAEPELRRAAQVYQEMQLHPEPPFKGFKYGLQPVFDDLIQRSSAQDGDTSTIH